MKRIFQSFSGWLTPNTFIGALTLGLILWTLDSCYDRKVIKPQDDQTATAADEKRAWEDLEIQLDTLIAWIKGNDKFNPKKLPNDKDRTEKMVFVNGTQKDNHKEKYKLVFMNNPVFDTSSNAFEWRRRVNLHKAIEEMIHGKAFLDWNADRFWQRTASEQDAVPAEIQFTVAVDSLEKELDTPCPTCLKAAPRYKLASKTEQDANTLKGVIVKSKPLGNRGEYPVYSLDDPKIRALLKQIAPAKTATTGFFVPAQEHVKLEAHGG